MSGKGKAGDVSGFDVVRAVKHVRERKGSIPPPPKKPPDAPPEHPSPEPPDDGKPARSARIGKTAVPTKYEYVCYECGYRFTVAGKVRTLYCAKCRTILNQADYTIDKRHDVSIVTAGCVTIAPDGIWAGGSLTARQVVIEGRHEAGSIKVYGKLEVGPGAVFNAADIDAQDILIRAGAEIKIEGQATYRDVELYGELSADLKATGVVSIRSGGHLKGRLQTGHLVVEDGGGLNATVVVGSVPPENSE